MPDSWNRDKFGVDDSLLVAKSRADATRAMSSQSTASYQQPTNGSQEEDQLESSMSSISNSWVSSVGNGTSSGNGDSCSSIDQLLAAQDKLLAAARLITGSCKMSEPSTTSTKAAKKKSTEEEDKTKASTSTTPLKQPYAIKRDSSWGTTDVLAATTTPPCSKGRKSWPVTNNTSTTNRENEISRKSNPSISSAVTALNKPYSIRRDSSWGKADVFALTTTPTKDTMESKTSAAMTMTGLVVNTKKESINGDKTSHRGSATNHQLPQQQPYLHQRDNSWGDSSWGRVDVQEELDKSARSFGSSLSSIETRDQPTTFVLEDLPSGDADRHRSTSHPRWSLSSSNNDDDFKVTPAVSNSSSMEPDNDIPSIRSSSSAISPPKRRFRGQQDLRNTNDHHHSIVNRMQNQRRYNRSNSSSSATPTTVAPKLTDPRRNNTVEVGRIYNQGIDQHIRPSMYRDGSHQKQQHRSSISSTCSSNTAATARSSISSQSSVLSSALSTATTSKMISSDPVASRRQRYLNKTMQSRLNNSNNTRQPLGLISGTVGAQAAGRPTSTTGRVRGLAASFSRGI